MLRSLWISLIFLSFLSCREAGNGQNNGHGHGHGHGDSHGHEDDARADEPATISRTVWTARTELFIEYAPPVAGKKTRFAPRLTVLKTMKALSDVPVYFVFTTPVGQEQKFAVTEISREGFYGFSRPFGEAGVYRLRVEIDTAQLKDTVDAGEVRVYANEQEAKKRPQEGGGSGASVSFLKEQQWSMIFRTQEIPARPLAQTIMVTGKIVSVPHSEVRVAATLSGHIRTASSGEIPHIGDQVQKDQSLVVMEASLSGPTGVQFLSDRLKLQSELVEAKQGFERAKIDLERTRRLYEKKAKSQKSMQEAESAFTIAQARFEAAEQAMKQLEGIARSGDADSKNPSRVVIRAPISGTIVQGQAVAGEYVEEGRLLFTIVQLDRVWVEGQLHEQEIAQAQKAERGWFRTAAEPERIMDIRPPDSRMITLGYQVHPQTRTVPIIFEVPNPDRALRLGMAVELHVETSAGQAMPLIPLTAVLDEDVLPFAFVQTGGESFEKRELTLGRRDRGWAEVLKGVKAGERVVVEGAYRIHLATMKGRDIPSHGHAH